MSYRFQLRWLSAVLLIAFSTLCSPGAFSQEPRPLPTVNTELGRENLIHVAASAQEIKLVLLKDSGLMVEVKRWIARDATANGQLVSDSDLTDDAIFNRLQTDVSFRSSITLLLQKYGHFQPKLNPESDAAKERELIFQERAKMLAESHRGDFTAGMRSTSGKGNASPCNPEGNDDCTQSEEPSMDRQTQQPIPPRSTTIRPETPYNGPSGNTTRTTEIEKADYPIDSTVTVPPLGAREEAYQSLSNGELAQASTNPLAQQVGRAQIPEILPTASNGGREAGEIGAIPA